jgi:hypothetical protein
VLAVAMVVFSKERNFSSLVFALLSPVMLIGNYVTD